jgi:uncharacterized membrane protein YjgN (DUF898 family)
LTLGWIIPWRSTRLQSFLTNRMSFGTRPLQFSAGSGPLYLRFAGLWVGGLLIVLAAGAAIGGVVQRLVQSGQLGAGRAPGPAAVGEIFGIITLAYLLLAIAGAWYRAGQINHFAAHTHLDGATFSGNASAGSLIWLALSNFLILLMGLLAALALVGAILWAAGAVVGPLLQPPLTAGGGRAMPGAAQSPILAIAPALVVLVLATGFALFTPITQARSARYLADRLSIVGNVDLAQIAQNAETGITRGEGLAQAFDIDAF